MLSTKAVNTLIVQDQNLQRVQNNLVAPLNQILQANVIDGVLVENVNCVANNAVNVKHGMNRTNVHVVVVNSFGGQITFSRDSRLNNNPNYVTLTPSATGSVDLWIF